MEVLKWWISGKTQSSYIPKTKMLGTHKHMWQVSALLKRCGTTAGRGFRQSRKWQKATQVPGSYFVSRHLNNAFRKVVYNSTDVRETLNEYTEIINKELSNKRREFGLGEN